MQELWNFTASLRICPVLLFQDHCFNLRNLPKHNHLQCTSSWTASKWQGLLRMTLLLVSASISFYQNISSCVSCEGRHIAVSPVKENRNITRTPYLINMIATQLTFRYIKSLQTCIDYMELISFNHCHLQI